MYVSDEHVCKSRYGWDQLWLEVRDMLHKEWTIVAHNRAIHKQCNVDGQRSELMADMEVLLSFHPRLINFPTLEYPKP